MMDAVWVGVNAYHAVPPSLDPHADVGSPACRVAAEVSTVSLNGSAGTVVAFAKSSLTGGWISAAEKTRSPPPLPPVPQQSPTRKWYVVFAVALNTSRDHVP